MHCKGTLPFPFGQKLHFRPCQEAGTSYTKHKINKIYVIWSFWKKEILLWMQSIIPVEEESRLKGNSLLRNKTLVRNVVRGFSNTEVKAVTWFAFYTVLKTFWACCVLYFSIAMPRQPTCQFIFFSCLGGQIHTLPRLRGGTYTSATCCGAKVCFITMDQSKVIS